MMSKSHWVRAFTSFDLLQLSWRSPGAGYRHLAVAQRAAAGIFCPLVTSEQASADGLRAVNERWFIIPNCRAGTCRFPQWSRSPWGRNEGFPGAVFCLRVGAGARGAWELPAAPRPAPALPVLINPRHSLSKSRCSVILEGHFAAPNESEKLWQGKSPP